MKIQYASDLHLEFPENRKFLKSRPLMPEAEILILAGDIIPFVEMEKHKSFFDFVSDNFSTTYWIPGNHEYYYSDINDRSGRLNEKIRSNIFLVNNISVVHNNVKLVFSTLWSKISPANQWHIEKGMSDFHVIKNKGFRFSAEFYNRLHRKAIGFIEKELNINNTEKLLVATHHVPTFLNYPEKYKNSTLNEGFAVELFDMIEESAADYWIYGHSHYNSPGFSIGKTRLLTNQLGYVKYGEQKGFCKDVIIKT